MRLSSWTDRTAPALLLIVALHSTVIAQSSRQTAITHVTVVDVRQGGLLDDQTVIVSGSRVSQMGTASSVRAPSGASIVDGRGKFLIPGLWNMHAHVFSNFDSVVTERHALLFPLYIANGVTGLRDMYTTLEDIKVAAAWTRAEEAGTLTGPAIVPTSTMINGGGNAEHHTIIPKTPEEARRVVDSLVAGGARTIKVQANLSREIYFAIADEAKAKGVTYVGHVTNFVTLREAAAAGQHSTEHGFGLAAGCSREEAEVMRRRAAGEVGRGRGSAPPLGQFILDTHDDSTCRALARFLADHDSWLVPTLVSPSNIPDDSLWAGHRGYPYTPASLRAEWAKIPPRNPAAVANSRVQLTRLLATIGLMSRNGASIMAGTDGGNWMPDGFTLHDELALMTAAGLSPLEALRTATLNPARFLGATDSLGSIAPGHVADLVLLDANPLLDIHNARRIRAVMRAGRLYDRPALDSLLAQARRVADGMR